MVASTSTVPQAPMPSLHHRPVRPGPIAELRHIQELLGHASVATTQIYTHVSIGHLKATLQRCHPRERATIEGADDHGPGTKPS